VPELPAHYQTELSQHAKQELTARENTHKITHSHNTHNRHTHIHTYAHTYTHIHTHARIHTRTHTHACINTRTHTHTHKHTHAYTHARTRTHTNTHTHIHTHRRTNARTHACLHTCIHTHRHTSTHSTKPYFRKATRGTITHPMNAGAPGSFLFSHSSAPHSISHSITASFSPLSSNRAAALITPRPPSNRAAAAAAAAELFPTPTNRATRATWLGVRRGTTTEAATTDRAAEAAHATDTKARVSKQQGQRIAAPHAPRDSSSSALFLSQRSLAQRNSGGGEFRPAGWQRCASSTQ